MGLPATASLAVKAALAVPNVQERDFTLSFIGRWQARGGDAYGALGTAELIQDEDRRADVLFQVGQTRIGRADVERAIQMALSLKSTYGQEAALSSLSRAQAESGDLEGAFRTAAAINGHRDLKSEALAGIAKIQAKTGRFDDAIRTASSSTRPYHGGLVLKALVEAELELGDVAAALRVTELFPPNAEYFKGAALRDVALAQLKLGDIRGAARAVVTIEHYFWRIQALKAVVPVQLRVGDRAGAMALTRRVVNEALAEPDNFERAWLLSGVGEVLAHLGDAAGAASAFSKAFEAASRLIHGQGSVGQRSAPELMHAITGAQVAAGQVREALRSILAIPESTSPDVSDQWKSLAMEQVRLGPMRSGTVKVAYEIAPAIQKYFGRPAALQMITVARAAAGDVKGALRTAAGIRAPFERDETLLRMAYVREMAKDPQGELACASAISWEPHRVTTLVRVALLSLERRDYETYRAAVDQAVRAANSIGFDRERGFARLEVAVAQALGGNREAAARTVRSAARSASGTVFTGWGALGMVWAQTGDADGALTWADGMDLSPAKVNILGGIGQGLLTKLSVSTIAIWNPRFDDPITRMLR